MMNASFPKDLLKIGYTKRDPEIRADELSQNTGLPSEYIVAYEKLVCNCELAERLIHERLKDRRPTTFRNDRSREFFKIKMKDAIDVINSISDEVGVAVQVGAGDEDPVKKITLEEYVKKTGQTGSINKRSPFISNKIERKPRIMAGCFLLRDLNDPETQKDSDKVIKLVKRSVKHFENALSIKDEETADYEIYNLIGLAYAFVFSKNHKYKTSLDKTTLLYYQEQSLKYHYLSIEKNPQSVVDYEFLATRYSKYIVWTKEMKVLEMLNNAKELNPSKAE